jgi:chaperonin GroES
MSRSATACCSAKWSGTEVKLDGQELLIMKENDIMGVLTNLSVAMKKAA